MLNDMPIMALKLSTETGTCTTSPCEPAALPAMMVNLAPACTITESTWIQPELASVAVT
jgi:hypothetical protein